MVTEKQAQDAIDHVSTIYNALPKGKRPEFLGELNEVFLVLEQVKRDATKGARENPANAGR